MKDKKGQSQVDFAIATLIFFIFFGFVLMTNPSPIYGFGLNGNTVQMDTHQTAVNIVENEIRNDEGVIVDERVETILNKSGDEPNKDLIKSEEDLQLNITITNADNPGGSKANTGKIPNVIQDDNTVGGTPPSLGTTTTSKIVSIDGHLVEITITTWR